MPCPALICDSKVAGHRLPLSAGAVPETHGQAPSASAAGGARDCRRSDAPAAVMQVRPLSVVSGIAGSRPVGRSAFGPLGWL